jgi:hypothetical protein
MFPPAWIHSPSFSNVSVWRLNEENVVNLPQIPTVTNCRAVESPTS